MRVNPLQAPFNANRGVLPGTIINIIKHLNKYLVQSIDAIAIEVLAETDISQSYAEITMNYSIPWRSMGKG